MNLDSAEKAAPIVGGYRMIAELPGISAVDPNIAFTAEARSSRRTTEWAGCPVSDQSAQVSISPIFRRSPKIGRLAARSFYRYPKSRLLRALSVSAVQHAV
jgi:hypothetical protein